MKAVKKIVQKEKSNASSLSKMLFIRGLQCHKSLWLQKFKPELKDEEEPETAAKLPTAMQSASWLAFKSHHLQTA